MNISKQIIGLALNHAKRNAVRLHLPYFVLANSQIDWLLAMKWAGNKMEFRNRLRQLAHK